MTKTEVEGGVIGQVTIAPQEYLLLCHQKYAAWDPAKNFNFGVSGRDIISLSDPDGNIVSTTGVHGWQPERLQV